jgi:hypothetical protein
MKKLAREWLTICVIGVVLPACATETPPPRAIAPPKRIPEVVETPAAPAGEPVNSAEMPREVRRAVVADAARRFRVAESAVVITRAERLTWSDGSLGCPEPGRFYTQNLVPGFRVVAKTSAGEFTYNTDTRGNVVTCGIESSLPANKLSDKVKRGAEPATSPPSETRPVR